LSGGGKKRGGEEGNQGGKGKVREKRSLNYVLKKKQKRGKKNPRQGKDPRGGLGRKKGST